MREDRVINWSRFGRAVSDVREARGFGLREQARELGITHSTMSRAENGKPVTVPAFLTLCAFAATDPYRFMTEGNGTVKADDRIEMVAKLLLGSVNAPEAEIYRISRRIVATLPHPSPTTEGR